MGDVFLRLTVAGRRTPVMSEDPLICIVEDEDEIRSILGQALKTEGHTVETFGDGEAFLEFAEGLAPDLVFLDIDLPGMDGWEVQERLRDDLDLPSTVFAVTASGGESVRLSAQQGLGFDDYFRKPFDLHTLLDATSEALQAGP